MIVRSYISTCLIHTMSEFYTTTFISTTRKFAGQNTYLIDAYTVTKYNSL